MITGLFSTLAFMNPWLLAGLAFLPAILFLLRVTPPSPRLIIFPPTRLLAGLQTKTHTTSRTPWWILLLRLTMAALVIIALARPVLNPAPTLAGSGPVHIIIDNGWDAGQNWNLEKAQAEDLITRAGREHREIYITATAPEPGKTTLFRAGPLPTGEAMAVLQGLTPRPWPSTPEAIKSFDPLPARTSSFFLSSGLRVSGTGKMLDILSNPTIYTPDQTHQPLILRPQEATGTSTTISVTVESASQNQKIPVTVQAIGQDGRTLDEQKAVLENKKAKLSFDLPAILRQQVSRFTIARQPGAGSVILLGDRFNRRVVGIVAPEGKDENAPLIEDSYYIRRALEPYAELHAGGVHNLLAAKPSVMILPDIGALPPEDLNELESWVRGGGLVLRFAGPNMTQGDPFLTPVPFRKGGRSLDGALTWEKPQHLAAFTTISPFAGLAIPPDITVSRQLLAEPVEGLDKMTWATLDDGTPLITAAPLDKGLLVMIHTTATPLWSDLSLSGLFVQLLRRTVDMAGPGFSAASAPGGVLQPLIVLDGFGQTRQPDSSVMPLDTTAEKSLDPTSSHPPGIYGRTGHEETINLGTTLPTLQTLESGPAGSTMDIYGRSAEKDLTPLILLAAFTLFVIDWLIMMGLQAGFTMALPARTAMIAVLILIAPHAARADDSSYAADLHLAHVRTGNAQIDDTAQRGLTELVRILDERTSVEPAGVAAINIDTDDLAFFPLLYWPVTAQQAPLSAETLRRVQYYLDHGGTIVFDTRDRSSTQEQQSAGLRAITTGLNIPPLIPMPNDHVLTRSFYLLRDFPSYEDGSLWVEENSATGRDGVSSIIIANRDWANAWTGDTGNDHQHEMALRFGVNLVMYALTGNYKADQVHLPHILERLGQ